MRYKLDELLNQITSRLPSNTTGAIDAQVLRDLLTDFVWSFRGATAYLSRAAAPAPFALTNAFVALPALFDTAYSADNGENEAAVGTQYITAKVTNAYEVSAEITVEGGVSEEVIIGILVDGVINPVFQQRAQLLGAGKPSNMNVTATIPAVAAGAKVQLGIRAETGTPSVTIGPAVLVSRLIPSRT